MPAPTENPVKNAVQAHFSTRPTLRSVIAQMLADTFAEKFPPLSIRPADLYLALPRDGGGRALRPLLKVALEQVADGSFPDLSTRHNLDAYLSDATGTRLGTPSNGDTIDYDLNVVSAAIQELPSIVFVGFQDALAAYWSQDSHISGSRWQWLAGILQGQLRNAAIRESGDDRHQLQVLSTLANYPSREARAGLAGPQNALHVYTLETRLVREATSLTLQSSEILVVNGTRAWLYAVSGRIESFANLDAFGQAWGERMAQQFLADTITWHRYEPDGNIFEVQAALACNQQLEDLAALSLPAGTSVDDVQALFESLTNPANLFDPSPVTAPQTLSPIQAALPGWLRDASPAERFAYRQCLLEQASLRRLTRGEGYLDELDDIRTYAATHLNHQLCLDRNAALRGTRTCTDLEQSKYRAQDLELTFHVPVGTLQSGYIQKVVMSLVDLALKNLSGRPAGRMTVRHTGSQAIEAWLTPEYLLQLIQRVNVGLNYPAYIQQALLSDTAEAQKRKRQFCAQRPIDLKTQALEHKIKGEAGLTARGVRCIHAVVGTQRADRWVDTDEIVMRALAFQRKPGAKADVAQNMFIIEPRAPQSGPHLLYRPAYRDAVLEFASRDSLLAAIAQPGEVQESVLAWLSDDARVVYSNGGFKEPHYVRISGLGADFPPLPRVPKPATLADAEDEHNDPIQQALNSGQLMEYLYVCEARQLLDQADRESTSNAESRWALILEGLQLGFNTLLMLVRGPLAAAGWLIQLALSLKQDLPALESNDPIAREQAWVDLLLNISMVLIHQGLPAQVPARPMAERRVAPQARLPLRRTAGQTIRRQPVIERGRVGLPSEPPGGGRTLLDFDRSLASDSASARLLEKLLEFNIPWPEPAPEPVTIGPAKGLFKVDNLWYASVAGLFLRVNIVLGFGEVFIIDPAKPDHPGIKLRTDGNGHWTLDRGLKLEGGGPKRLAQLREQNRRQTEELVVRIQALTVDLTPPLLELNNSLERMYTAKAELIKQSATLKLVYRLLEKASVTQKPALETRHQHEMQHYGRLRTQYETLLGTLEERFAHLLPQRLELVKSGQDLEKLSRSQTPVHDRAKLLKTLWEQQFAVHNYLSAWTDILRITERGEPMRDLAGRMVFEKSLGNSAPYDQVVARTIELADTEQRMAVASHGMETILEALEQDSVAGRAIREELLAAIVRPQRFFSESVKLNALIPLSWIAVEPIRMGPSPQEALYVEHLHYTRLSQALLSHIEVRSSSGYPLNEQRQVYNTVLEQYRSYEIAMHALKLINPARVHPVAERLLKELQHARMLAEDELETVLRKQEELEVDQALSKNLRPKAPTKRIFKTSKRTYLIGDLQPATEQINQEHLTLSDAVTGETISSFRQQADSWVEIREDAAPPPQVQRPVTSLASLKSQGQALIKQRAGIEQVIAAQQRLLESPRTRQTVDPGDWDQLLTEQARQLTVVADEIARDHLNQPAAQALIDDFQAHAKDMRRTAQNRCSAAYKRQLPTLESLDYLWRHKEVDINLTSLADPQRPTLSGDFFTEYAVYDKAVRPPTVLWYAHFHYASADAPPAQYTRAHLKLASQRKYTQKDLLKQHVQAQLRAQLEPGAESIETIVYVLLTPPQDQLFLAIAPASHPRVV